MIGALMIIVMTLIIVGIVSMLCSSTVYDELADDDKSRDEDIDYGSPSSCSKSRP